MFGYPVTAPPCDPRFMLIALQAFVRALNHRIRTPLSVVGNEISYFSSKLEEGECARAAGQCRSIAMLLSEIAAAVASSSSDGSSTVSYEEIASFVTDLDFETRYAGSAVAEKSLPIAAAPEVLHRVLRAVVHTLGALHRLGLERAALRKCVLQQEPESVTIVLTVMHAEPFASTGHAASLTELVSLCSGSNDPMIPIADALLLSLGGESRFEVNHRRACAALRFCRAQMRLED